MRRKTIIGIFALLILTGFTIAEVSNIIIPPKEDEIFNSNLSTTIKTWLNANNIKSYWTGNLYITNGQETYKQEFCYIYKDKSNCEILGLIIEYSKESLYCFEYKCLKIIDKDCVLYSDECLTYSNMLLKDLLQERYIEKADEVLLRLYKKENRATVTTIDTGNKTIITN